MAKNSIRDYSATNSSNTDIQSIDISEGCSPAGINNAIREVMADLKDVSTGAVALESPAMDSLTVDTTGIVYSGGNVGIGVAPSARLDVQTTAGRFKVKALGGSSVELESSSAVKLKAAANDVILDGASNIIFDIADAEKMRIDGATGNVGIGGLPSALLHLEGSDGVPQLKFLRTGTTIGGIIRQTSAPYGLTYDAIDGNTAAPTHVFRTSTNGSTFTERMRLDSTRLRIGTGANDPGPSVNGVRISGTFGDNFWISSALSTAAYDHLAFYNPNGLVGYIRTSGTSTSYVSPSDYRLKENVTADWDATTRLKQLNPVRFNFIADADTTVDGFLAHEVQDIVPEAIAGTKDGMRDEEYTVSAATGDIYTPAVEATYDEDGVELTAAVDEVIHSADVERPEELAEGQQWRETTAAVMGTRSVPDYQGIDQSKLVPLLVKTIQELEARITALEAN